MKRYAFTGPYAWAPTVALAAASVVLFRLARRIAHIDPPEIHADLGTHD